MPSTYTLISSNVLSSSAASVTFSAIPSTYTDLVLRWSIRSNRAAVQDWMKIELNADTTNLSYTRVEADGTGTYSGRSTSILVVGTTSGNTTTSNTFGNGEFYIPSYTASQNKPVSGFGVGEDNAVGALIMATAGLWRSTSAITEIKILSESANNLLTGSSFYLYGIKNS